MNTASKQNGRKMTTSELNALVRGSEICLASGEIVRVQKVVRNGAPRGRVTFLGVYGADGAWCLMNVETLKVA